MQNKTIIGFIGAGNMAYALIKGLINNGYGAENIKVSDLDESLLNKRKSELGIDAFTNNTDLAAECDVVVLAIKPQVMSAVCKGLQGAGAQKIKKEGPAKEYSNNYCNIYFWAF